MSVLLQADSALISQNLKTTSLILAEKFGKQHKNVMRDIRNLEIPDDYRRLNFEQTGVFRQSPLNGAPIKSIVYEMTRDGFSLLVMGFTGKKAMAWKIKFLKAFNEMERAVRDQRSPQQPKRSPGRPPKLSRSDILGIVEMSGNDVPRSKIAKQMNCTYAHVTAILKGVTRSDITGIQRKPSIPPVRTPVLALPAPTKSEHPTIFPKQRTMGGSYFDPFNFKKDNVYIGDIAHTLSNLCCFNGHTDTFHSIADHSINLSRQFRAYDPHLRMQALLYHSPAAYLMPLTSGMRKRIPELRKWENEIRDAVFLNYGLKGEAIPAAIIDANKQILALTAREMMGVEDQEIMEDWGILPPLPNSNLYHSQTQIESHGAFLTEYDEINRLIIK